MPSYAPDRQGRAPRAGLIVGTCHKAGFAPLPGPRGGALHETLATIGTRPLWTVVSASHARVLHAPRVAFVPFREPGLALSTGLAVHAADSTPYLDTLLLACGDHRN